MNFYKYLTAIVWAIVFGGGVHAQELSTTWVADLGNGSYKNPVLWADYSDPDVVRVGKDYYMTSSSFNCIPGLPILHSNDLVNWTLVGHAIRRMPRYALFGDGAVNHGGNVWAPSIRHHKGEFYIYYGDPDIGIFMTKTKDPAGEWEPLTLVKEGKGLIDACPLFDENGQVWLAHAFAGSRAGMKSLLAVTRLTPDGKKAVGESVVVYDGHDADPTIEGPKFYKKDGWYWIFAPAGGVATGWQLALRSRSPWGPYERRVVMDQGTTSINGPHQGAWVDTPSGKQDWFLHFQDVGPLGRIVHLQPMKWAADGWPVIGEDLDGDGCGQPVITYKKPDVGRTYTKATPAESDEFDTSSLGLQWQWHGNPEPWWMFTDGARGVLSLYSVPVPEGYRSLWDAPNLLMQKMAGPASTVTVKLNFRPSLCGERAGLVIMGLDYASLAIEKTAEGLVLSQSHCPKAENGTAEIVDEAVEFTSETVYLRASTGPDGICDFSYSKDGEAFKAIGKPFAIREGKWIGAEIGVFCTRPEKTNDGGRVEIESFRVAKYEECPREEAWAARIHILGDSTTEQQNQNLKDQRGWPQMLPAFFNGQVAVLNHGKSGTSSRTFYEGKWWENAKKTIRSGDYVVIQFAHNDEKHQGFDGETGTMANGSYREYLQKFADDIREMGAIPIFATPIVRKMWDKNGRVGRRGRHDLAEYVHANVDQAVNSADTLSFNYTLNMKEVAAANGCALIDMTASTAALVNRLGNEISTRRLYNFGDATHICAEAALLFSKLFVHELKSKEILAEYIVENPRIVIQPATVDFSGIFVGEKEEYCQEIDLVLPEATPGFTGFSVKAGDGVLVSDSREGKYVREINLPAEFDLMYYRRLWVKPDPSVQVASDSRILVTIPVKTCEIPVKTISRQAQNRMN